MAAGRGFPAATTPIEWPVAQIPTPPTASHRYGALLVLRWVHHGNLRIVVDELDVHVNADDLYALAEYPDPEQHPHPHPHPTLRPQIIWARHEGDELLTMYTLEDAVAVLEHEPTHQTPELLTWLREQLPLVVRDEVIDHAIGLAPFLTAWTVQQAAIVLDSDPRISMGRTRLFKHLEHIDWIYRDALDRWAPHAYATRHELLTLRDVTIRSGTRAAEDYAQLYVTEAGLAELRRTLGILDPAPPNPPAPEQLPIP